MSDDGIDDEMQVEVENENICGRLGNAICCIVVGVVLFLAMFPLLFWNEKRAVDRRETLLQAQGITVEINPLALDKQNVGKLVYFQGLLQSSSPPLEDPIFGVTGYSSSKSSNDTMANENIFNRTDIRNDVDNIDEILILNRKVEMYMWYTEKETKSRKKHGGGTETTTITRYRKHWSEELKQVVDKGESKNPPSMPFMSQTYMKKNITVGPLYQLPSQSIGKINWYKELDSKYIIKNNIKNETLRNSTNVLVHENEIYIGKNSTRKPFPEEPIVGDVRITYSVADADEVTIVAKLENSNGVLTPFETENGGEVNLFKRGTLTKDEMYEAAQFEAQVTTWILRFVGYALMAAAIYACVYPIEVIADVVPFLGDLVGCGLMCFAVVVATFFAGTTIAIAWLIHRPIILIIIILIGLCLSGSVLFVLHKTKKGAPTSEKAVGDEDPL